MNTEKEEKMIKVLTDKYYKMEEYIFSTVRFVLTRDLTVYDKVVMCILSLGRCLIRERKEFGFVLGREDSVKNEEDAFKEDLEFLGFLECVLEVLKEGKDKVSEDFSGLSREWFLMEMCLRFGLQEEEVKSFVWKTIQEGVRRRLGTIDIKRPVSESNCFLSLLSVF